ncbi:MAG TPA: MarR family transcriptional regulator [Candidatus Thermoplasmatota archaeon]|nr:MarR family transcriptional regulator [Candidatus Thermoplasmatota archaeon]
MGNKSRSCPIFLSIIVLGFLPILLAPSIQAADYYADLTITVDFSGFVSIAGLTNYPNLTIQNTEQYTSKQQSYWLLNITKQETFSEFVYDLTLPKGSSISYMKSSGSLRIEENLGSLIIRGFGENESLSILIQYQTEKQGGSILQDTIIYLILLPAILLVTLLILFFYLKEKKTRGLPSEAVIKEPLGDMKGLNHRQKQIMQLLHERNIPLTQTDIQKELEIPKASVSRNIHGLERKGLIEKEQIGMSNLIRLKKQ